MNEPIIFFDLGVAMLCENCKAISNSRTEACPKCKAEGCLLALHRPLNQCPELGEISFIFKGRGEVSDRELEDALDEQIRQGVHGAS